jgi:hypothetical protein
VDRKLFGTSTIAAPKGIAKPPLPRGSIDRRREDDHRRRKETAK